VLQAAVGGEEMASPVCPRCLQRDRVWMRDRPLQSARGSVSTAGRTGLVSVEPLSPPAAPNAPWSIPSVLVVTCALTAATIADLGIWPHPAGTLTPGRIALWTFAITAVAGVVVLLHTLTSAMRQQHYAAEVVAWRHMVDDWEDEYQCQRCMDTTQLATMPPFPSVHLRGFRYYPGLGYRRC